MDVKLPAEYHDFIRRSIDDGLAGMRVNRALSVQEQMGVDPISKLAAAIERLCDTIDGAPN